MAETLRPDAFEIRAFEGRVLVEAPGVVATFNVEAAFILSDRLIAACGAAGLQTRRTIGQQVVVEDNRPIHWV